MQQRVEALNQLARIAITAPAAEETLTRAASIICQATGAAEAIVVYAEDRKFLTRSHTGNGPSTELTLLSRESSATPLKRASPWPST
jgi:hypothetical protein